MPEFSFKPEHKKILDDMMQGVQHVVPGKMFGYPGYKVNGKLAVGLFDSGIILKVGPARVKELAGKEGIEGFEPLTGRVWKDWLLLTSGFEQQRALFEEAVQYVLEETK